MSQSRKQSLVESIASTAIGYGLAVASQVIVFPLCGVHATFGQTIVVAVYFTAISLVRQYAVRRWFARRNYVDDPPASR